MKLPSGITVCEVGLRDGLQNETKIIKTAEKLDLAKKLIDAGFKVIEIGSFMSPRAVPQMADTDELFSLLGQINGVELRALIPNKRGVERAIECGCRKVKLNVSASREHNLANLNRTPEESVAGFEESVNLAVKHGIEVSGSISMPFGSPWEGSISWEAVQNIVKAYMNVGVTEISLSDAPGMAVPNQVYSMCNSMKEHYPQVKWWLHFHNTRGMAMANVLAAMQAGITRFDSSFAGLGGCPFVPGAAGNVASEDLVHMMEEMGVETGIDMVKLVGIAKNVRQIIGHDTDSYILRAGLSKDLIRDRK